MLTVAVHVQNGVLIYAEICDRSIANGGVLRELPVGDVVVVVERTKNRDFGDKFVSSS